MTSASTRVWTLATALLIVIVIALGWFLGAAPQLAEAARADTERQGVVAQNIALRAATDALAADFAAIDELRDELDEVRKEFPAYPQYAEFVESFLVGAAPAGLVLTSLQVTEPTPVSPEVIPDENGQVPAGTLMRVPVTVAMDGTFRAMLTFINAAQRSDRFTLVSTVSHTDGLSGVGSGVITFVLYVVTEAPVTVDSSTLDADEGDEPPASPSPTPSTEPSAQPSGEPTPEPTDG